MKRFALVAAWFFLALPCQAAQLYVGAASCDITPPKPVALDGQMGTRISHGALTPITANAIALESREGDQSLARFIILSMDMVGVRPEIDAPIRAAVKKLLPDFDVNNLVLCGTHTHTAPVADPKKYYIPEDADCMRPAEFDLWAADRIAPAIARAWNSRVEGQFSYGLGHAVVAYNRRSVYANGSAAMYGKTNSPDFRCIEGVEDHDVNTMFFWNASDKLLAMIVNVSCPAQEVEGLSQLHADYWHPTRQMLHGKFGEDVCIVALCGAAGDMSPHTQYRKAAEDRMSSLRKLSRIEEIGRRIAWGVEESYEPAKTAKTSDVVLKHEYAVISLPQYRITEAEYKQTKSEAESLKKAMETDPNKVRLYSWANTVVARYEAQQKDPHAAFGVPIHVMRIGETAMATNPFELFTSYGIQMKARSKARQTFVVQLTDGCGICGSASSAGYLPTALAYQGGGYSAIVKSICVGPEGGQVLVEETLKRINAMW